MSLSCYPLVSSVDAARSGVFSLPSPTADEPWRLTDAGAFFFCSTAVLTVTSLFPLALVSFLGCRLLESPGSATEGAGVSFDNRPASVDLMLLLLRLMEFSRVGNVDIVVPLVAPSLDELSPLAGFELALLELRSGV
jgi:hypothetical protein